MNKPVYDINCSSDKITLKRVIPRKITCAKYKDQYKFVGENTIGGGGEQIGNTE
jgi:hypothetical protein